MIYIQKTDPNAGQISLLLMDVLWINLVLEMKNLLTQNKDQVCLKM